MAQIIFIGSIREYLEWDKKKTKDPGKYKSFEIIYDFTKIRKEVKKMSNNNEKRFTKEEAKVNTYMAEHPGVSYRDACLAVLDSSEGLGESTKEFAELNPDEIIKVKKLIDDTIYNLSVAKKSEAFRTEDQRKLDQAYNLVAEVKENLQILIDKNA